MVFSSFSGFAEDFSFEQEPKIKFDPKYDKPLKYIWMIKQIFNC